MNDEYLIYGETLTAIADSIRSVSSVSTTWTPDEMAAYILANLVKPTTRQAAKTYTPSTSNQTIPAGTFLTGAATIQGDADWVEGNIKKGVNMWGKTGTLSGIWGVPDTFYGFTAVKSGSFTFSSVPSQNAAYYTVTHNLGSVPRMILYYATGGTVMGTGKSIDAYLFYSYSGTADTSFILLGATDSTFICKNQTYKLNSTGLTPYDSGSSTYIKSGNDGMVFDSTTSSFKINMYEANRYYTGASSYLQSGKQYRLNTPYKWIALA